MTGPRSARSLGDTYVYDSVRAGIIDGTYAPGSRIGELEVAEALKVSRTPVRQGFNRLVTEGLLEQLPTGGVAVPVLDPDELSTLYITREVLEGAIARAAAIHATSAELAEMAALVYQLPHLQEEESAVYDVAQRFHNALANASRNRWCAQFLRQLRGNIDRYRSITNHSAERRKTATEEHIALFEAVAAHDADLAEQRARAHVAHAREEALRSHSDT